MSKKNNSYYVVAVCLLLGSLFLTFWVLRPDNTWPVSTRQNLIAILLETVFAVVLVTLSRDIFQFLIINKDIRRITGELFATICAFLIIANAGIKCLNITA